MFAFPGRSCHERESAPEVAPAPAANVHLGAIVARSLQFRNGGDPYVPAIKSSTLKMPGMKLENKAGLLEEIDLELEGIDLRDLIERLPFFIAANSVPSQRNCKGS